MVLKIIATLIPVFGIILLGLAVARRSILPMEAATGLNQFVYWIALPAITFNILARLNTDGVSGNFLLAVYLALAVNYLLSFVFALWFFRADKAEAAMLGFMANFPNGIFMGIPVVSFLLPADDFAVQIGGLCAFLYAVVMPYTDTVLEMLRHKGESLPKLMLSLGKTMLRNPMIIAGSLGLVCTFSGSRPPEWALNTASMLGGTAAPCALFAMGMVMNLQLAAMGGESFKSFSRQLATHVFKLAVLPCVTFLLLRLCGVTGTPLGVATLMAAMPTGVVAYVIAQKHHVCVREASMVIVIDTAASVATIPAVIAMLYALNVFSL